MEATLTVRVTRSINCDVLIGQPLDSPNADYLGVHVLVACHSTSSLPVRAAAAWSAIATDTAWPWREDAGSPKRMMLCQQF